MSKNGYPTNDPELRSWIESANNPAGDFPIQNLPMGVFSKTGSEDPPRVCVAIGDQALDLSECWSAGLFAGTPVESENVFETSALNEFLAMGHSAWSSVRQRVSTLLRHDTPTLRDDAELRATALNPIADITLHMPVRIGDYTDFYASIHHATNVGSMFRPDNPLLPNYKRLPVGYHGRASSVIVSGEPVRRPHGQLRPDESAEPVFGPSRLLDYEFEMGFFTGPGNEIGERISMDEAMSRIFGMVIVNDWSARDVQKWEYQPLGPFNAKNFATSISPWVVSLDALSPFMEAPKPRGPEDPPVLDYLKPVGESAIAIRLETLIQSKQMRERGMDPMILSRGDFRDMYWTIDQMLTHHTSTGCNMRPGDMLASGTVSGAAEDSRGCMLELTWRGSRPIRLPTGEERKFLEDGDVVVMRAYCERDGAARIGFGECRGEIVPAK
ncbi:MAG: fumarylacetoacetase [Phycisphaeraceae bacterium]|nr:MAG: fumarylacetoacetase [Phycisphaeraceae bacterium]